MNAQTPAWHRYMPQVEAFRPGCSPEEMRTRCGILHIRDAAIQRRRTVRVETDAILSAIETMGIMHATASMPLEELNVLYATMGRLLNAASNFDAHGPGRAS